MDQILADLKPGDITAPYNTAWQATPERQGRRRPGVPGAPIPLHKGEQLAVRKWSELSTTDFEQVSKKTLVVVPIGAMEQAGPHLPVGTDTLVGEAVVGDVIECLEGVDCIFMPILWCSKSNEHARYPGTVDLSRQTLAGLLEDIAASVVRAGFQKIVFINFHGGGNTGLISSLLRDIRQETGLMTFSLDNLAMMDCLSDKLAPRPNRAASYEMHGGHGGTSVILARYPELMQGRKLDNIGSDMQRGKTAAAFSQFEYLVPEGGPVTIGWMMDDLTADGVVGNPATANAEDGEHRVAAQAALICELLKEIAAFEFT